MTTSTTSMGGSEFVPLAERSRYMQAFRVLTALVAVTFVAFVPDSVEVDRTSLVLSTLAYVLLSLAGSLVWRLSRERGLTLFGALLITDGVFLAWASFATGGTVSPLRYLMVLHLIAVALLASYRTGLKLALWHSILLFAVHYADESSVAAGADEVAAGGLDFAHLASFVVVFWLVAIGTATFSAVNERELRRHRADLEILARMAASLEEAHEETRIAQRGVEHIVEAFDLSRAVLVTGPAERMRLIASVGDNIDLDGASAKPEGDEMLALARQSRHATLVQSIDDERDPWLAEILPDARNLVLLPLSAEGSPLGVLVVEHPGGRSARIERRLVSILERFASHIALSLHNSALVERLKNIAETDGLTGIANRRRFDSALSNEIARSRRTGSPVSLVILDLDHFKDLNDTYGHQAGDEVLRRVAAALTDKTREFDLASRYGGEEFAVIMPDCSPSKALRAAERLRSALSAVDAPTRVTASAGVACYPANATTEADLVRAADSALYAAKRAGRDRVVQVGPRGVAATQTDTSDSSEAEVA